MFHIYVCVYLCVRIPFRCPISIHIARYVLIRGCQIDIRANLNMISLQFFEEHAGQ